jgi:hypothetical protein
LKECSAFIFRVKLSSKNLTQEVKGVDYFIIVAPVSGRPDRFMSQLGEVWEEPGCTVVVLKRCVARCKAKQLVSTRKLVGSDQT